MRSRTFLISPDPATISKIIGGNTPTSSLTLQSTSGVGTTDSILFTGGNNGATVFGTWNTTGLGIGTAPAYRLDIATAVSNDRGINILNNGVGTTQYGILTTVSGAATTNVGGYFTASGATNNYGLIVNAGNVGISTTNPATHKLQVAGSIGPNVDNTAGQDLGTLTSRFANGYIVGLHSGASSMTQSVGAGDTLVCTHTTTSSIFTTSVGFGVQTSSTATNVNGITGYITMLTAAGATIKVAVLT